MRHFLLIACLFCSINSLHADVDDIYVQLSSEVELMPIFVSQIDGADSELAQGYPESIRQVLLFDINNNGATRALTSKEIASFSSLGNQNLFEQDPDFAKAKSDGLLYLVKLKMKKNELICKVVSVNGQTATLIDHIFLSGDLAKDRQKIHQLSDSIHKLLFGKNGIASCRIIYTVKKRFNQPKGDPKWLAEVFMSDYDGYNIRQLTHDNSLAAHALFMPQGNKFLYVSYKIGQPKLYVSALNEFSPQRVTSLKGIQVTPSINTSGNTIAFSSDVTGRADIFLQPLGKDQKPMQIFTAKGAANASPTFSPDGIRVAFVSDKDGSPKVYVMKIPPTGTKLKDVKVELISKRCRENSAPSWSPDGKKIAYCGKNSGERQIWIYDVETKTERQLTQGKANKENPTWAPDSLHLLFNAQDGDQTDIYLINLNQPNAQKITSGPGAKLFPSWEPKPR